MNRSLLPDTLDGPDDDAPDLVADAMRIFSVLAVILAALVMVAMAWKDAK